MKLENSFTVDADADAVWTTMLDFERVAACVPGSEIVGQTDDGGFEAKTRVKVGPMTMTYRGVVAIAEQDDTARRAVMEARAREARGQGTATAQMVMAVHDETPVRVTIDTDFDVTGRVAQMGRGVLQDVAGRIVDAFAENFRQLIAADGAAPEAGPADPVAPPAPADQTGPTLTSVPDGAAPTPSPLAAPTPPRPAPAPASTSSMSAWALLRAVVSGRLRALRARFGRSGGAR